MINATQVHQLLSSRAQIIPIMQTEAAECGLACLAMIARYHGDRVALAQLRRRFNISLRGVRLERLVQIGRAMGLDVRAMRAEPEYLQDLRQPCILHWDMSHFVVLERVVRGVALLHDPARGALRLPMSELGKHFTGVLLELQPAASFQPSVQEPQVSLRSLTGRIFGLKRGLLQIFGLALAIEVLALLLPFQMQWVIDHVLVSADMPLLKVLTIAFLLIVIFQAALTVARSWIVSWLGASLNTQWITNLFGHLLRLPLEYFEKRHMGDVLSRFSSLKSIQTTLTGSFVEAMLNGMTGCLAVGILLAYSPALTGLVLGAFALYLCLRLALYRLQFMVSRDQLTYAARQQSELMESVRGIQAIKLANKQGLRQARLFNATAQSTRLEMQSQRFSLAFNAVNQGLFGTQRVFLIAIGGYLALNGTLSAGMLVAFLAYADLFTSRAASLVDKSIELKMLRLHAERISDIATTAPELDEISSYSGPEPVPEIQVKGLSFRYSDDDPWVIRNLDLRIEAGESVAIVGPSGCGKSTLVKLLLGLIEPTEGAIEIGGIDIRKFGLENYRAMVAAVMQDDQLFAGSLADNIAFFDPDSNIERIASAAHLAAIHDDIVRMPMGYESLVGDMGSILSGGQRQRIVLARALYRHPKILILDEATSHLDSNRDQVVNAHIKAMKMTRIIIAHRQETIASADRRISLVAEVRGKPSVSHDAERLDASDGVEQRVGNLAGEHP
ncbi:ATP-binding cassette subfamily B protein RaxB [Xanthomonas arboricola]|uniref:ABC transporter n=1 Tax=Xanthomonas cannabis pv. phaseoli TaxID=1885902 RepID=A0AB34PEG3_9XANT|nr:peptidase domain-containing ABC transporter [Xanthomonas cannabis]KGK59811.1 ABC transporter [Xanthomonas cannabis pv. phaseoli]NIK03044.1 ATP-binding cassette subfamily B protein RaxB [Xanthomonas cannabis]NIK65736.1 ATP-binding cassette subfamily B protein RaxB [Xanthomonas cannabis]